jgi:HEAT repeat protein
LAKVKNDEEAVTALGVALNTDPAWGLRDIAADALGRIGSSASGKQLLAALDVNTQPYVRNHIVAALGAIKEEPAIVAKLVTISRDDASYRSRANALQSLGKLKAVTAFPVLTEAVKADSPDDFLRNAALRSLGFLGDDRGVPLLRQWAVPGKAIETRQAAIASLGRLEKGNKAITAQIASYLTESHYPIRYAAIRALGSRGDASAIPALQSLLKRDDLSIEMAPTVKEEIARLQKEENSKKSGAADPDEQTSSGDTELAMVQRLDRLEHLMQEVNDRLKSIESRLTRQ